MLRLGVALPDDPEDETEERATYLMRAINEIDDAVRPALRGERLSTGDLFRRLGKLADAAQPKEN